MVISMKYQVNLMVQTQEIGRNPSGPNLPRHACRLRSKISFHEKSGENFLSVGYCHAVLSKIFKVFEFQCFKVIGGGV